MAASADEARQVVAAVAELRRQYKAAGVRVAANTSGLFVPAEARQVAAAFRQVGEVLERWATVHRNAALSGRWEDGREAPVRAFLDFGRVELADAVEVIAGEAYDRSLFAALKYTVQESADQLASPLKWPPWLAWGAAGAAVLLVTVVALQLRRGGGA